MIYELSSLCRAIRNRGLKSVLDFTFGPAGQLIVPSQNWSEIEPLLKMLYERKPKVIVEIGTKFGGTLAMWCAVAHPEATIVSIDLPSRIHGVGYAYWRTVVYRRFAQLKQTILLLRHDSHQQSTLEDLKKLLPGEIDFLFCDGDHPYEGVKQDYEMYSPLVRHGGLKAFHDICRHSADQNCGADKFWQEICGKHESREYIENPNQGMYGIGVLEL